MGLNNEVTRVSIRLPNELKDSINKTITIINRARIKKNLDFIDFSRFVRHCIALKLKEIKDADLGEDWLFLENLVIENFLL